MGSLTTKQKELINENDAALDFADLPFRVKNELIEMNDYETLVSDVDRYLFDRKMEQIFG